MTTTTKLQSIEAARLDAVIGGCKKGCPPPQQQQQIVNNVPRPMGPPPGAGGDGPVDIAVDVNGQTQTQAA